MEGKGKRETLEKYVLRRDKKIKIEREERKKRKILHTKGRESRIRRKTEDTKRRDPRERREKH